MQTHWAKSAYDGQVGELPAGEEACFNDPARGPNPKAVNDCDVSPSRIFKASWSGMEDKWPAAYEILSNYQLAVEDQQPMMGAIDVDGGSVEEVVATWMAENEGKWRPVVDAATQ